MGHFVIEGDQVGQAGPALREPMLARIGIIMLQKDCKEVFPGLFSSSLLFVFKRKKYNGLQKIWKTWKGHQKKSMYISLLC